MKKIQITAKNVQKAIDQGLKELDVKLEDVDVKILDEGGIFRKAKVELVYNDGNSEIEVLNDKKDLKKEKKTKKETKKIEKKVEKISEKKVEKKDKKTAKNLEEICTDFLEKLFEKMTVKAKIDFNRDEDGAHFNVSGERVGALIGKRGETLNAISEILSNIAKKEGFKEEKIFFDVENYRERRKESLIALAERMAKKAVKIEKPIKLERMNAYERKIIHTALQDFEGVTTKSEGEQPNRYLVIVPTQRETFKNEEDSKLTEEKIEIEEEKTDIEE